LKKIFATALSQTWPVCSRYMKQGN